MQKRERVGRRGYTSHAKARLEKQSFNVCTKILVWRVGIKMDSSHFSKLGRAIRLHLVTRSDNSRE